MKSDRMRTVQLNVCDSEEVGRAVDYITSNLKDPETGGERERPGSWSRSGTREGGAVSLPSQPGPVPTEGQRLPQVVPAGVQLPLRSPPPFQHTPNAGREGV